MRIRSVTRAQLDRAIETVNAQHGTSIRAGHHMGHGHHGGADIRPLNARGDAWSFTIRLASSADPFHRRAYRQRCGCRHAAYRRTGEAIGAAPCPHKPPRMNCVCWHGHREVMRAIFAAASDPEAVIIRTGIITYKGATHFEATHDATGDRNIGSQSKPLEWADACDCDEPRTFARRDPVLTRMPRDAYGQDEANGAACRAMATALASIQRERKEARA